MHARMAALVVELRLWHALDLQLLAPFEYDACDDATDFSAVPWDKPGEREAGEAPVTGNDVRARLVVLMNGAGWRYNAARPRPSCSCVSVAHAEFFMTAWQANCAGLPGRLRGRHYRPAKSGAGSPATPAQRRVVRAGDRRSLQQRRHRPAHVHAAAATAYAKPGAVPAADRPAACACAWQESCLVLDFVGQHRVSARPPVVEPDRPVAPWWSVRTVSAACSPGRPSPATPDARAGASGPARVDDAGGLLPP